MSQLEGLPFDLAVGAKGYSLKDLARFHRWADAVQRSERPVDPDLICRDEACQTIDLHIIGPDCRRTRVGTKGCRTRSKTFAGEPWRAFCFDALRDSVFAAVSLSEPRTFQMIVNYIVNDYGTLGSDRTVHRHLCALRSYGKIVRMDFKGRLYAYLRAGSRLLDDPGLVFDQIKTTFSNDSGRAVSRR